MMDWSRIQRTFVQALFAGVIATLGSIVISLRDSDGTLSGTDWGPVFDVAGFAGLLIFLTTLSAAWMNRPAPE